MINVEKCCWETNFDCRHDSGYQTISFSADTLLYFKMAYFAFSDLINRERSNYLDKIASKLHLDTSDVNLKHNSAVAGAIMASASNLFSNDHTKQLDIAKDLAVGSVDVSCNLLRLLVHGDGQDKSLIKIEILGVHTELVSCVSINEYGI